VINASNIVVEVVDLKISFSLSLHLVGAPIGKTLNHLRTGGKAIDGLGYLGLSIRGAPVMLLMRVGVTTIS
jgi:hypothetical protein